MILLSNTLGEFISVLLAILLIGMAFIWLARRQEKQSVVATLPQPQIAPTLVNAARTTRYWHFKGGTGTFLKAITLPVLADTAAREIANIHITIQIIDPRDAELCKRYASIQRLTRNRSPVENVDWDALLVRRQSLATLLAVFVYADEEPRLKIGVFLHNRVSHFRYDMSDDVLVITREHPTAPALKYSRGYFYETYKAELELEQGQCFRVAYPDGKKISRDDLTPDMARALLREINMAHNVDDEDLKFALQYLRHPHSPYQASLR